MAAETGITPWHWLGFIVFVLLAMALDLGVFHRRARTVAFREAMAWTVAWFGLAMLFGFVIAPLTDARWEHQHTLEFVTGYIIEYSLSLDNVFVIAVLFAYFHVAEELQHRVLFWGVLGALVMRGVFIGLGVALVQRFDWLLMVLGAFLVVSGFKLIFFRRREAQPEKSLTVRLAREILPVAPDFDGQNFFTRLDGRLALTTLALVLLLVEVTDLIFAFDSIPAVFAVTTNPFIVFTSNIFAVLGLRSLYFVLAGAIASFRHLKTGLAVVLVFIGAKMLLMKEVQIALATSFGVVVSILAASILASLFAQAEKPPGTRAAGRVVIDKD
jgi:tellurite resistance protein TerC